MFRVRTTLLHAGLYAGVFAALGATMPLHAANWQTIVTSQHETVAIDTSRIARGGSGTTAWSRINLGQAVPDQAGAYDAIEAQNLYDCSAGNFTTLRRSYFKGSTLVRDEAVSRQRANRVVAGSVDQRLLNEACKPRTIGDAQRVAAEAARAMTIGQGIERPSPMHADMRSLSGDNPVRVIAVADAHAERPKMIQLPPIDKAAAEAAAAGISPAKAATGAAPAPAPAARTTTPSVPAAAYAPKTVAPQAVPRAVEQAAAAENRHTRELILATSGPRKVTKPKKEANPAYDMHTHWGYDGAGAPSNWSKLRPEYATCENGKRQSPIDIREGIKVDLDGVRFNYRLTKFTVVDNGHTIQVNVGAGSTIHVMGKRYELVQFHFHKPSEERVNGRPYDMVIHFVHKDYDDNLAVIAVLLETGTENPQIQTVWNNMPLEANVEMMPGDTLDPLRLIPENRAYWTYMGSLTTPPCTENVLWMVMKQPVQVSAEQIGIFSRLYRNNARPVQAANGRLVKESR